MYKPKRSGTVSFAELLDAVAIVDPEMRIRFTSPHPKEFSDEVLQVCLMQMQHPLYTYPCCWCVLVTGKHKLSVALSAGAALVSSQ